MSKIAKNVEDYGNRSDSGLLKDITQNIMPPLNIRLWIKLYYLLMEVLTIEQHITERKKPSRIKIYKLCDEIGYTYDMKVNLGKNRT
jgi:hypothetical protein